MGWFVTGGSVNWHWEGCTYLDVLRNALPNAPSNDLLLALFVERFELDISAPNNGTQRKCHCSLAFIMLSKWLLGIFICTCHLCFLVPGDDGEIPSFFCVPFIATCRTVPGSAFNFLYTAAGVRFCTK